MSKVRFYPADENSVLRDPVTHQRIGADGIEVDENDRYWLRREREGGVSRERPRAKKAKDADDVERI